MRTIGVTDTTLRDAHQCLWATRMTTAMMLPIAETFDRAGFAQIDLMGMIQFDVAVRYLKEDPWERIREIRKRIVSTPLRSLIRSRNLLSFDLVPDDVIELFVERLTANGIGIILAFDGLNDVDNLIVSIRAARRFGIKAFGALAYSHSPVHTDDLYVRTARELLKRVSVDTVVIKDSGGLLTPDRVRTLVPALKAVLGDTPLEIHSHCLTGLAPQVYLDAVTLGADIVDLSVSPLANGPAQPAAQELVPRLRALGYSVGIDDGAITEISKHFSSIAERENKPVGETMDFDPFHYEHQLPGGMKTNFEFQLEQAGMGDKLDAVLHECARIRAELGWPIMITPFSQLVGTQAALNVLHGKRYAIVPDEVKKYVLGYYGRLVAPVDPDVKDRIIENGSQHVKTGAAPDEGAVEALRRSYPDADDDERLLRYMFLGSQVDEMRRAARDPLDVLREEIAKRREISFFSLRHPGAQLVIGDTSSRSASS